MAYVVGIMDEEEMRKLEELGFKLEKAPKELTSETGVTRMVWVDCSVLGLLKPKE